MIKQINCTLDMYDWIMEGAYSEIPRCQNQSESYSTLKASFEVIITSQRCFSIISSQEQKDVDITGGCKPPCRWTDFSPHLMNYGDTGYVGSRHL